MKFDTEIGIEELEARLLLEIAETGESAVEASALSLALAARCLEEVRVWVEDFRRAHGLVAEEDALQQEFRLRPINQ